MVFRLGLSGSGSSTEYRLLVESLGREVATFVAVAVPGYKHISPKP